MHLLKFLAAPLMLDTAAFATPIAHNISGYATKRR